MELSRFFFGFLLIVYSSAIPTKIEQGFIQTFESGDGCRCEHKSDYTCECQANMEFLGIEGNAFLKLSCLTIDDIGISVIFEWNNDTLINQTISARNPPPICIGAPDLDFADICFYFYDLSFDKTIHGCLKIGVKLYFPIPKIHIGCINIPMKTIMDPVKNHNYENNYVYDTYSPSAVLV